MKDLRFVHLRLSGFGRFPGTVQIGLAPGLNVVAAPNESGKSTLVSGLAAALFGLPGAAQDGQRAVSRSRLRSIHGPLHFGAQLTLQAGDVLYRIERHFDTASAWLSRQHRGRWELVASTEKIPAAAQVVAGHEGGDARGASARDTLAPVDEALGRLLGLSSRDLFDATFCLPQPLPETTAIGPCVQQLLATAGSEDVRRALAWLERHGAGLAAAIAPLEARHAHLESLIRISIDRLDAIEPTAQRLAQAREEHARLLCDVTVHRQLLSALAAWRSQSQTLEEAQREAAALTGSLADARAARRVQDEHQAAIDGELADLAAAPPMLEIQLGELASLEEQIAVLEEESEGLARGITQGEAQAHLLEGQIATRFSSLVGKPDLLDQLDALERHRRDLAQIEGVLTEAAAREAQLRPEAERLARWTVLGDTPLATFDVLQQVTQEAIARWRQMGQRTARIEALSLQLGQGPGALFAAAPEALRAQLRALESEERRLDSDVAAAEGRLAAALARLEELNAQAAALASRYADIEPIPDERLVAVQRRIGLLKEQASFRSLAQIASREAARTRVRQHITALVGLLVGLQGGVALAQEGWLMLLLGVLGCFPAMSLTWGITGRLLGVDGPVLEPEPIAQRLLAIRDELAVIEAATPLLASHDLPATESLRLRIIGRMADRTALDQRRGAIAAPATIEALGRDVSRARAEREALAATISPIRAATQGSVSAAFRQWERLAEEKTTLEEEVRIWAVQEIGATPDRWASVPAGALPGRWRDIAALATLMGLHPSTASELATRMARLEAADWGATRASVARHAEVTTQLALTQAILADAGQAARRAALRSQVARLSESLRSLPADMDRPSLARQLGELAVIETRKREIQARVARARSIQAKLAQKIRSRERAAASRRESLAPWLARWAGSVSGVRSAMGRLAHARSKRELASQTLEAILAAQHVPTLAALEARHGELCERASEAERSLDALVARTPSIATLLAGTDRATLESRLMSLSAQVVAVESRAAVARAKVDELVQTHAQLCQAETINVAAARREQDSIASRLATLRHRAKAVEIAAAELAQASEDYTRTYCAELTRHASLRLQALTGLAGRHVVIDRELQVSVRDATCGALFPAQLSLGARDQLTLALRLGLADLLAGHLVWPIVLDDPVASWDAERLDHLRATLGQLATGRQVILLTHRMELAQWGQAVALEEEAPARAA